MKKLLITAALLAVSVGAFASYGPYGEAPAQVCINFHIDKYPDKATDPMHWRLQLSYPGSGGPFTKRITKSQTICVNPWKPGLGPHAWFDIWSESDDWGGVSFTQCSQGLHTDVGTNVKNIAYVYDYYIADQNGLWDDRCGYKGTQAVDASKNWSY